jgi:preprotein translocase subunit SecG
MEKLKALIAVALFVAALLFSVGNNYNDEDHKQSKVIQTVVIDKR